MVIRAEPGGWTMASRRNREGMGGEGDNGIGRVGRGLATDSERRKGCSGLDREGGARVRDGIVRVGRGIATESGGRERGSGRIRDGGEGFDMEDVKEFVTELGGWVMWPHCGDVSCVMSHTKRASHAFRDGIESMSVVWEQNRMGDVGVGLDWGVQT